MVQRAGSLHKVQKDWFGLSIAMAVDSFTKIEKESCEVSGVMDDEIEVSSSISCVSAVGDHDDTSNAQLP